MNQRIGLARFQNLWFKKTSILEYVKILYIRFSLLSFLRSIPVRNQLVKLLCNPLLRHCHHSDTPLKFISSLPPLHCHSSQKIGALLKQQKYFLWQVGVKTFLKLFQTYSNSKVFFPAFKETPLENLTLNEALQNHGMKLVKVSRIYFRLIYSGNRQRLSWWTDKFVWK